MDDTLFSLPIEPITDDGERSGRGERRDAAANRHLLLQTAEALFAAHGVDQVTMADIAKAAGVGKGTLYRRFDNKGELALALMDAQMRAFQETQLAAMRRASAENVPFLAQLAAFLDALVAFVDQHAPLLCEAAQIVTDPDVATQRPHFWQYLTVTGLLNSADRAGELRPGLDIPFSAEALLAPLNAHTFRYQRDVLRFDLPRISAGLQSLVDGLST